MALYNYIVMVSNKMCQYFARTLLFILGWSLGPQWVNLMKNNDKIVISAPASTNWDIFLLNILLIAYPQKNLYILTDDDNPWHYLISIINTSLLNTNVHKSVCVTNLLPTNFILLTVRQRRTNYHHPHQSEYANGYFHIARLRKATIVTLQLDKYEKQVKILNIQKYQEQWDDDNFQIFQPPFIDPVSYLDNPTSVSPVNIRIWKWMNTSYVDWYIFLPFICSIISLILSYTNGLFVFWPLIPYCSLWMYTCRLRMIYNYNNRINDRNKNRLNAFRQSCYELHYLIQGVLLTEMSYILTFDTITAWVLTALYIVSWDYVRCISIYTKINEMAIYCHLQITLWLCCIFYTCY